MWVFYTEEFFQNNSKILVFKSLKVFKLHTIIGTQVYSVLTLTFERVKPLTMYYNTSLLKSKFIHVFAYVIIKKNK